MPGGHGGRSRARAAATTIWRRRVADGDYAAAQDKGVATLPDRQPLEAPHAARSLPQSLADIQSRLGDGSLTLSAIVDAHLATIGTTDPQINAFVSRFDERARAAAEALDQRRDGMGLLPLEGATVAVKDNIDVAGVATTGGIQARSGTLAGSDATCVARLKAAGAILLGKTNLPEGGLGASTDNPLFGPTRNPRDLQCSPGGSSGGSAAAVAAGMCLAALGTDTLGSIRLPAAYCGVVGFKPTYRRIPAQGVMPLAWSLDTVGILAGRVADAEALFRILDETATPGTERPWRFRIPGELSAMACAPDVARAFERALAVIEALGGYLDAVPLGLQFSRLRRAGFLISEVEAAVVHEGVERSTFSPGVAALLEFGDKALARDLAKAQLSLRSGREVVARHFSEVDFLVTPTVLQTAFPLGADPPVHSADLTALASVARLPAISLPIGTDSSGLPVGLQIVAGPGADESLLAAAAQIERQIALPAAPAQRNGKSGLRFSFAAAIPS